MGKQNVEKTALVAHSGLYTHNKLPFELSRAPATLQKAINVVLATIKWLYAPIYVDGIIILTRTLENRRKHIEVIQVTKQRRNVSKADDLLIK